MIDDKFFVQWINKNLYRVYCISENRVVFSTRNLDLAKRTLFSAALDEKTLTMDSNYTILVDTIIEPLKVENK